MPANFYPVILAGGRGTRFWPLSRKRRAKQVLALDGDRTMIQQTVARLLPLAPAANLWVITNAELRPAIRRQLPRIKTQQVRSEEHTSELQSRGHLVCRLLLEKKKKNKYNGYL